MKTKPRTILGVAAIFALGTVSTLVVQRARAAGIPEAAALTYTGYLEAPDGTPVSGDKNVALHVFNAEKKGTEVCKVDATSVTLTSGRFQLTLPDECTDAVKAHPDLWVEVEVEAASLGRTKLGAVPYAVEAGHATSADEASASGALATKLDGIASDIASVRDGTPKITAWTSFTPTVVTNAGTAVTGIGSAGGKWRRVGDSVEVQMGTSFNADVVGDEYLTWQLPDGLLPPAGGYHLVGVVEASNGAVITTCTAETFPDQRIFVACNGMSKPLTRSNVGVQPKIYSLSMHLAVQVDGWTLTSP